MAAGADTLAPLPQAPGAAVPLGLTAEGAARAAWRPNVFAWVAVWRLFVVVQGLAAMAVGIIPPDEIALLVCAGLYTLLGVATAWRAPTGRLLVGVLLADLAICIVLLAAAAAPDALTLMALFSYSTAIAWASLRPVDAFIGAGACAASFAAIGAGDTPHIAGSAPYVGSIALYLFFALATAGFFTVVRRIGALEVATEISRERGRYRRDLHDRLGQALCGLHFELQAVHSAGADTGAAQRLSSLADGYRDARAMLVDLFGGGDEPMVAANVATLIQQEARRMSMQTGARIDVDVYGEAGRIPPWMRPHICAIAGECTTNAVKNGRAEGIDIELAVADGVVVLSVTDDGEGFDNPPGTVTEKEGHYGLREMAERARLCGGEVVIASQPGFGTRVRMQAPLPDGGSDDIIDRDVSSLRASVWSLFTVLRTGLGLVAIAQAAADGVADGFSPLLVVVGAFMLADIGIGALLRDTTRALITQRSGVLVGLVGAYSLLLGLCLAQNVVPYFMLFAPLLLIGTALYAGRQFATRLTVLFAGAVTLISAAVIQAAAVSEAEQQAVLLYVTNLIIVGLSASQGARLLDRLETLQIRVRYQALARLRHGLSHRMRDQLMERLDVLEGTTRSLAERATITDEEFAQTTGELESGSSDLKRRLREIVHQLADPTPGRTVGHV